ncbi:MAG: hypothetical protein J7L45_01145 [Candidatus Aenigmarchaeota archaeon]|nr:hypothetical protein [Candidatus Aenigmarchaeota archaeon]
MFKKKRDRSLDSLFYAEIESQIHDELDFSESKNSLLGLAFLPFILENRYGMDIKEAGECTKKIMKECEGLYKKYKEKAEPTLKEFKKELNELRDEYVPKVKEFENRYSEIWDEISEEFLEKKYPGLKQILDKLKDEGNPEEIASESFVAALAVYEKFLILSSDEFLEFEKKHPKYINYKNELDPLFEEALKRKEELTKEYRDKLMPIIKEWRKDKLRILIKNLPDHVVRKLKKELKNPLKKKKIEETWEISRDELLEVFDELEN